MTGPLYTHNCEACVFLGHLRAHDLYFCEQRGIPTVIARYGNAGAAYTSGMALAHHDPILWEARGLAIARGLIPPDEEHR